MAPRAGNNLPEGLVSEVFRSWYEPLLGGDFGYEIHPHFLLRPHADAGSIQEMAPMTASDLLQNPKKTSGLLFDGKDWHGVIEIHDQQNYLHGHETLSRLAAECNTTHENAYTMLPVKDWYCTEEGGRVLFVSKFMGPNLEQRWAAMDVTTQAAILDSIKSFIKLCAERNVYWRDLAPRNMLLGSDTIHLIDFEHVYKMDELSPFERAKFDKYRRVWFADMLREDQIDYLFSDMPPLDEEIQDSITPADIMERIVLGKAAISALEELEFIDRIASFERQHAVGGYSVKGHRMGLYLSDFQDGETEARVYTTLEHLEPRLRGKFYSILEQCINVDQKNRLAHYYGVGEPSNRTREFLESAPAIVTSETRYV